MITMMMDTPLRAPEEKTSLLLTALRWDDPYMILSITND